MSLLGNIQQGSTGGGGQAPLVSTGAGVPVFNGTTGIASIEEISGVRVSAVAGAIGLTNRLIYFFVKQFGAVGDGVTDDTAAIQAAFTACGAAGGGVVFFSTGSYLITSTINWPAGITITALGASGTFSPDYSGSRTEILAKTNITAFNIAGGVGCRVENLAFIGVINAGVGNAIITSSIFMEVIACSFSGWFNGVVCTINEITRIVRCTFAEVLNHMIDLSNSVSPDDGDCTILDCVFTCSLARTAAAIFQRGSGGTKVLCCKFVSSGVMGFGIQATFPLGNSTSDLLICNCSIEICRTAGISVVVSGATTSFFNVAIVGCNISSNAGGMGIVLTGTGATLFNNISITGNCINANTTGILLTDVTGVYLTGNTFMLNTVADVTRAGVTVVNTGVAGDDNGSVPANPVTPVKWLAWTDYSATGPVSYRIPLYQ
jgi:hypothetical protein